jgi:DNA-directed RNA polymerase specialized sigma24 family protein
MPRSMAWAFTVNLLIAYSKRLDLVSELVSAVERLRAKDADEPETGRSVRSEQAPCVWRVSDRLSEAELHSLVSHYLAGITARELAEQFKISKSSVKRLLRERGIRRTAFIA